MPSRVDIERIVNQAVIVVVTGNQVDLIGVDDQ